ncbi:hypothetical protein HDV05_002590 [Chytridiales sp. JEL 0842]|nr:hypothetical protein HDV05_002590 [Chytridiales sp. JEL 0842]
MPVSGTSRTRQHASRRPEQTKEKMGSNRFALCHCLFWTKALLAFMLANSFLAYYGWKVYDLHINAPVPSAPPVQGPISLPQDLTQCYAEANPSGTRLMPASGLDGKLMLGFSLHWETDRPSMIKQRVAGIPSAPAV